MRQHRKYCFLNGSIFKCNANYGQIIYWDFMYSNQYFSLFEYWIPIFNTCKKHNGNYRPSPCYARISSFSFYLSIINEHMTNNMCIISSYHIHCVAVCWILIIFIIHSTSFLAFLLGNLYFYWETYKIFHNSAWNISFDERNLNLPVSR